jgi:hypothetical protein
MTSTGKVSASTQMCGYQASHNAEGSPAIVGDCDFSGARPKRVSGIASKIFDYPDIGVTTIAPDR